MGFYTFCIPVAKLQESFLFPCCKVLCKALLKVKIVSEKDIEHVLFPDNHTQIRSVRASWRARRCDRSHVELGGTNLPSSMGISKSKKSTSGVKQISVFCNVYNKRVCCLIS